MIHIIAQACQSLAEAHDAGLLHRDIKPANLFLCRAADEVDIVKLLDFGIVHNVADPIEEARVTEAVKGEAVKGEPGPTMTGERLTEVGVVIGTPGYIPPEQAVGARLDARGDLYALGCVAWYLLVGTEVYPGADGDEVMHRHVADPIPSLRAHVRGWLPPELEGLLTACLAKRPAERPADARALADALFAIEIPKEHAWTRAQAIAWWSSLAPTATSAPEVSTAVENVVAAKPGPAPGDGARTSDAATVAAGQRVLVRKPDGEPAAPSSEARTIGVRRTGRP